MGSLSFAHWAIVLLVVLLLFGRGRISDVMGDFGKGIHSFRKGLSDESESAAAAPGELRAPPVDRAEQSDSAGA